MKKKALAVFLCFCMAFTGLSFSEDVKAAENISGSCGNNATYELNMSTGELTISGTGDMEIYKMGMAPWGSYSYVAKIKKITIKEGITSIGNWAFYNCIYATSVSIPSTVRSIGTSAFRTCQSLSSVSLPGSVTRIADQAFSDCTSLTSFSMSNNVTTIGEYAFSNCTALNSITLSSKLSSIDTAVFSGCKALTSITIPNSVKSIGESAFTLCSNLSSVSMGSGVRTIGKYAFQKCSNLKSIDISNGVTSIEAKTFELCSSLTSIYIPKSVTAISGTAFFACSSLKEIRGEKGSYAESYAKSNGKTFTEYSSGGSTGGSGGGGSSDTQAPTETKAPATSAPSTQQSTAKPADSGNSGQSSASGGQGSAGGSGSSGGSPVKDNVVDMGSGETVAVIPGGGSGSSQGSAGNSGDSSGGGQSGNGNGNQETTEAPASPDRPQVKGARNGISILWNEISGSNGYIICRKEPDGSWIKLATIKDSSVVTFTDERADEKQVYTYVVQAFNDYGNSNYSLESEEYAYISGTQITGIKSTPEGIRLKWDNASCVTGYMVYRSTNGGKSSCVAFVNDTTYLDRTATVSGKAYSYRVVAYHESAEGVCYLSAPSCVSTDMYSSKSDKYESPYDLQGIKITWKPDLNAVEYVVYRSVNGGLYKEIKATGYNAYTDKTAREDGEVYDYKVMACYSASNGKKYLIEVANVKKTHLLNVKS